MSTLTFGLTRYYSTPLGGCGSQSTASNTISRSENKKTIDEGNRNNESQYSLVFVIIYGILLAVCALISKPDSNIYVPWNEMGAISITQLVAAIMLTFFLPGYSLVQIICKKNRINPVLKVLLAYLLSILISGGIEYISAMYLDHPISETKYLIIGIHLIILLAFLISRPIYKIRLTLTNRSYHKNSRFISHLNNQIWRSARSHSSELLVFGSLLALLVVSTYYVFGGITIGDQWFHQGRTILFMSGSIRETALSHADTLYAPFQSAVLATLTALSGIPLVNAYASIAFLNIIPAFGYYYFFSTWMSLNMRRAKIIATTLFVISSGFGWIYLLGLTVTIQPVTSQRSVLDTITSMEPFDIFQPPNFFLASHPDFSTGLIYIAIPAGFVMLGILRDKIINKYTFCFLVTLISILGILIHDEFYLFTIVASFIPLIFRIKYGSELYLGLILAYLIVYIIDITGPQNYYTSNELFGLPLLFLSALFTASTWALYLIRQSLHERLQLISIFFKRLSKQVRRYSTSRQRNRFLAKVIVVSIVGYFYGLSFIVSAQLSTNDIIIQTAGYPEPYNIPWYLYPIKFGITGLIALACILSYLFKRFEKEVFVFGIIGVIALFAGPYYDEHRFSKYIMAGMAGFASILLYKILISLSYKRPVVNRTIIVVIITVASLSSLLYVGYNSLILQTQEYVHSLLSRRNFPTQSEMPLFQLMHDKIDFGSKRYNILTFPKEYDRDRGLMTFFQAFSGLPETKVFEKPLTLNVTTLDAFYRLLDLGGIRYIVIPKATINERLNLSEPVRFALDNFKHTYENNKYIVLDVPDLKPPSSSSETDIALIYNPNQQDKVLSSNVSDSKLLKYDNKTFNFGGETNFVIVQDVNKPEKAILADQTNKGITLWSRNIDPSSGINYVQVSFRIIDKNENGNDVAGLKWKEGDDEYYISLSKEGLELSTDSEKTKEGNKIVFQNAEVEKKNHAVYDLELVSLQKSINVFLNDTLRIQLPLNHSTASEGISKVGISESNGIVQLGQIKIGRVPENLSMHSINNNYNNYPLSILALSNSSYRLFTDTDLSSFSKKLMILTSDLESNDTLFNSYLEYAKKGGKVVVINPGNFKGRFSELFGLQPDDNRSASFTRISNQGNESIGVPGMVKKLHMNLSQGINVISDYRNKSNMFVAPFVLEKDFPNGGKILYVNSQGYFNSLSKSPSELFMSLSKIPTLLDIDVGKSIFYNNSEPAKRFIGDLNLDGRAIIKTSSFLLPNSTNNLRDIHAKQIVISDKVGKERYIYNNVSLVGLKLIGKGEITINSTGKISLPRMGSQHDYVSMPVPHKFNMTVHMLPDKFGSVEMKTLNGSIIKTREISNNSIINIYEITRTDLLNPIPLLVKTPDVIVNGHIHFTRSNFDPYFTYVDMPLDIEGKLETKIAFVDNYKQTYENGSTKLQYVTFLQSISLNRTINNEGITFEPPGDISHHAKELGLGIPLKEALLSFSNIILIISIAVAAIVGSWFVWPKMKLHM
jgi:hypothetical protein